jgi:hypothetical protein
MLYIKVENGQTVDHPVFPSNLMEVFGCIPDNYEPFNRVDAPIPGIFEHVDFPPTYDKVNGVWSDVWTLIPYTDEERAEKIAQTTENINASITHLSEEISKEINEDSTDDDKEIVAKFIEDLNAMDLSDPFNVKWPPFPRKKEDGHFLKVVE